MSSVNIIKLKNLTPLHIGTDWDGYEFSAPDLHSDTLSAALASLRARRGKTEDLLAFMDSFAISSAFPYSGDTLFLPRPFGNISADVQDEEIHDVRKALKKIRYIALPLWNSLVQGKTLSLHKHQLQGAFMVEGDVAPSIQKAVTQRVTVGEGEAKPFFFEWEFFAGKADGTEESGLYCIVQASDDSSMEEIVSLFRELGEEGIGSDRNVGGGHFDVEVGRANLTPPSAANAELLLSLYIPTEKEIESLSLQDARYKLIKRRGYTSERKVFMFVPGSVFPTCETLGGKIVNLRSDGSMHPMYRSGKPVFFPIVNMKGNE